MVEDVVAQTCQSHPGSAGINAHSHPKGAGPAYIGSGVLSAACSGILQASF